MITPEEQHQNESFLHLHAAHEASLHASVRAMLSGRMEAPEVLQNVIVVLWQKLDSALDFKKWAFCAARQREWVPQRQDFSAPRDNDVSASDGMGRKAMSYPYFQKLFSPGRDVAPTLQLNHPDPALRMKPIFKEDAPHLA